MPLLRRSSGWLGLLSAVYGLSEGMEAGEPGEEDAAGRRAGEPCQAAEQQLRTLLGGRDLTVCRRWRTRTSWRRSGWRGLRGRAALGQVMNLRTRIT